MPEKRGFSISIDRYDYGTVDPGESATRIAAVKLVLHHLLDDRLEESVLLLEAALILGQEPVKIMKEHPGEKIAITV
jgi:hypothetical protein